MEKDNHNDAEIDQDNEAKNMDRWLELYRCQMDDKCAKERNFKMEENKNGVEKYSQRMGIFNN